MKKQEIINNLKEFIKESSYDFDGDKPAIRELFNIYLDNLCKDGVITEKYYNKVILTDRELKSLLATAKNK